MGVLIVDFLDTDPVVPNIPSPNQDSLEEYQLKAHMNHATRYFCV